MSWSWRQKALLNAHRVQYRRKYTAGAYYSCVGDVTCLRPSAFAPGPSLDSNFVFPLSSFSFSRPSSHFCLHDLSRIPTNFWRVSLLSTPYHLLFCCDIFVFTLRLIFCILPLLICATAHKTLLVFSDLSIRNYAIGATRPTVATM